MAIDEKLAQQVRTALADASRVREVKMFGGLGFMLNGNMVAATSDRGLLVRVGEPGEAEALARPGAEPMLMRGRAMTGYVRVKAALDARSVKAWVRLARSFVETLPAKTASKTKSKQTPATTARTKTATKATRAKAATKTATKATRTKTATKATRAKATTLRGA